MSAKQWIGILLVIVVVAAGGYLAATRFIQSQPRLCPLSNRPIEPRLAYTLTLEQGKTMTVCCPRCAIRYELGRPTEVQSRLATDYETRQRFQYESREPDRSRYWRYTDIQQIGRLDPYRFEISTFEDQVGGPNRVFNFELKRQMEDIVYDYVWVRVNRTKYYPYEPEQPAGVSTTANTARVSTNKGGSQ